MDMKRKKQLLEEYKNRRPEMGVISYRCLATNESFDHTAELEALREQCLAQDKQARRIWR